ncbi:MAG: glycosyltransferase family 10 [Cyclobacteriaceae bacterium]
MKKITIDFLGCGEGRFLKKDNNFITNILSKKFEVIIDERNPDYLFCGPSLYSKKLFKEFKSSKFTNAKVKIYYTGEAISPDFNLFDYSISPFHKITYSDRHLHNLFIKTNYWKEVAYNQTQQVDVLEKTSFCNFMYSHQGIKERGIIFDILNQYKKVDAIGKYKNNTILNENSGRHFSSWFEESIDIKKGYKFSIAFENDLVNGYTTEKILSSYLANSIPIYLGNPKITTLFNENSFINCHKFKCLEDVVGYVKEIDLNDDMFQKIITAKKPTKNLLELLDKSEEKLEKFLFHIIDQPIKTAKRIGQGTPNIVYNKFVLRKEMDFKKDKLLNLLKIKR